MIARWWDDSTLPVRKVPTYSDQSRTNTAKEMKRIIQVQARAWPKRDPKAFAWWCELADLDTKAVLEAFRKKVKR